MVERDDDMPKISIIVPVYNEEEHLKTCLDTLVNQSLDDIEIILIDDASVDSSFDILKEYAAKYPQFKVYCNMQNIGQGATRNFGITKATGEYIGFLDADDAALPTMYEAMYKAALDNGFPDMVEVDIGISEKEIEQKINNKYTTIEKGRVIDLAKNPLEVYWTSPSCCNKIIRRDFLGDYRFLENCVWEDVAFTYSLMMKSDSFVRVQQKLYLYRRDIESGVSAKGYRSDAPLGDIFRVADEIENQAKINGKEEVFREVIPLLQEAVCFQRLSEINSWDVSEEIKNKTMIDFYNLVNAKYGYYRDLDTAFLSAKANLFLIEDVEKMASSSFESEKKIK